MNKLEEIRKISAELKAQGIFTIDFIAVEYAENQKQFEKIINAYYKSDNMPIKELIENLLSQNKFEVYHSSDFGKTWEFDSEIQTNDIITEMSKNCMFLGDDYLYDDGLRVVYNNYGEIFAYLNSNETEKDLKNKRVVKQ